MVESQIAEELQRTTDLTCSTDSWTSCDKSNVLGTTLLTPEGKVYVLDISDASRDSHTGEYLAGKGTTAPAGMDL